MATSQASQPPARPRIRVSKIRLGIPTRVKIAVFLLFAVLVVALLVGVLHLLESERHLRAQLATLQQKHGAQPRWGMYRELGTVCFKWAPS